MPDHTLRLAYKKYGKGDPLIILHGLFGASVNWHTLARSVFCRYYSVYSIDQRNHGRSPHADLIDYPSMAADLRRFLDDHGIEKAHLIGHSMGGKTAMEFSLEYPGRVEKLVIVDVAPKKYPPRHADILKALLEVDLSEKKSRADVDSALADRIPDPAVRRFLLKNLSFDPQERRYRWDVNLRAIQTHYEKLNERIEDGRTFRGPTLVIRAADSDYVEDADEKTIKELFPNAEFVTIENAGHWVHADQPETFADHVRVFLG